MIIINKIVHEYIMCSIYLSKTILKLISLLKYNILNEKNIREHKK